MLPTRKEWDEILRVADGYILAYLSNPDMWTNKYYKKGKMLFYDDETRLHDTRDRGEHLIDCWEIESKLVGEDLITTLTNSKEVDGYNVERMLSEGTRDYTQDNDMVFWYRMQERWIKKKSRKGIGEDITTAFKMLVDDALDYGTRKAYREWRDK